jgi:hypothetical protein
VLRALTLCTCYRHYPGAATEDTLRPFLQPYQPSPKGLSDRPVQHLFRGLLGVHSRYALYTHWIAYSNSLHWRLQPLRYLHDCSNCFRPERFSQVGLSPTGKAQPYHGARAAIADSLTHQPPPTAFEIGTHRFGLLIMHLTILLVLFVLLINAFMLLPFLPFLPMLPTQILLNNILCNFSLCHGDRRSLAIYLFGGVFRLRSASRPVLCNPSGDGGDLFGDGRGSQKRLLPLVSQTQLELPLNIIY